MCGLNVRRSASDNPRIRVEVQSPAFRLKKTLFCQEEELQAGTRDSFADVLTKIELKEVH
jgi:hypothetical protein